MIEHEYTSSRHGRGGGSASRGPGILGVLGGAITFLLAAPAHAQDDVNPELITKLLDFDKLFITFVSLGGAVLVSRIISSMLDRVGERFATRRLLLKKLASLSRFIIYIATVLFIVFGVIEPEKDTLLALGTAAGVTIGFALKDLVGSMIAGVIVLVDSPFQVGDRVQFADTYGEVVEIGLRTVKINTLDDSIVSIPNNKFLTEVVSSSNAGELDMMVIVDFYIGVQEDHDLARRLVYEATITSRYTFLEKPVVVHVLDLATETHMATRIQTKFYVIDVRYETAIKTDISVRVKREFKKHGILPPYRVELDRVMGAEVSSTDLQSDVLVELRSMREMLVSANQEILSLKEGMGVIEVVSDEKKQKTSEKSS